MHYHEHLGKQAISFLRNLMKQYGNDKFEEQFFEMLKSYPSLNGLLLSDMKKEYKITNKEVIEIINDRIIYKMRKLKPSDFKEIALYNDLLKDIETIKEKIEKRDNNE